MKQFIVIIKYLLGVLLGAIFVFSIFRGVLFISSNEMLSDSSRDNIVLILRAFLNGVWFDNVIACYIAALPLLVLLLTSLFTVCSRKLVIASTIWFGVFYSISFFICTANIPYFYYFFTTINSSIYEWFDQGTTTAGLVLGEASYRWNFAMFLLIDAIFILYLYIITHWCTYKLEKMKSVIQYRTSLDKCASVLMIVLAVLGCFIGIRGRLGYNPIKVSQAYYCQDSFLNQLGLNPVHYLMYSTIDLNRKENKYVEIMDSKRAADVASLILSNDSLLLLSNECGTVSFDVPDMQGKNIVLIYMESMSEALMAREDIFKPSLTPFLDSMSNCGIYFSDFYSAGVHTNHGLFAGLYSRPALMKRNLMKGSVIPRYNDGLPNVLASMGYNTVFFMTHESQYDNMEGFFRTNGYQEIFSQEDYPSDKVVNSFGVPDDYLFEFAGAKLDEYAMQDKPFFATLLTISNHPPYVIPEGFVSEYDNPELQIVQYADRSLSDFFHNAQGKSWFDNTIFIFMADHGKIVKNVAPCEIVESYNHIPLIIYSKDIQPLEIATPAGQIDLEPTVLGLIGADIPNDLFGRNLLHYKRDEIFFTSDNAIGVKSADRYYIYMPESKQEFCYERGCDGLKPLPTDSTFLSLKEYGLSMIQYTENLIGKNK